MSTDHVLERFMFGGSGDVVRETNTILAKFKEFGDFGLEFGDEGRRERIAIGIGGGWFEEGAADGKRTLVDHGNDRPLQNLVHGVEPWGRLVENGADGDVAALDQLV